MILWSLDDYHEVKVISLSKFNSFTIYIIYFVAVFIVQLHE